MSMSSKDIFNLANSISSSLISLIKFSLGRQVLCIISLCGILCIGVISGCTVGPDFERPTSPSISHYTSNGSDGSHSIESSVESYSDGGNSANNIEYSDINNDININTTNDVSYIYAEHIPKQWWQLFNSKVLDGLVTEALQNNQTLVASRATLTQAQQNLRVISGSQIPQIDGNASVTPERITPSVFGVDNVPTTDFVLYSASVNVSYNLDLFGSLKRQVEAYGALAEYEEYQMAGAKLTIATNVTNTVFKLALLNDQISNTKAIINAEESMLFIAKQQLSVGGIAQINVNDIEKNLLQAKNSLPGLIKSREQTKNQLAIYLGKTPAEIKENNFKLEDFSAVKKIPLIVPSSLARQRPDILAAEAILHQASAEVGVATANMYPQFNITGSIGPIATQNDMQGLMGQSWIWSFGPNVTLPIFHGGSLNAQRKSAIAAFDNALANYKQTVLQGLQNVADCLNALDEDNKSLQIQEKYYATASQNLAIVEKQYNIGGASLAQLLNLRVTTNQALIDKLQAQSLKLSDTVALFQSLGGGWW